MADERHIIDIILNARDNTSAAMAAAAAKIEALSKVADKSGRDAKKMGEDWENSSRKILGAQAETEKQLGQMHKNIQNMSRASVDAQVALEKASRDYGAAINDTNRSVAERAQLAFKVEEAQRKLIAALKEQSTEEQKVTDNQARGHATRIRQLGIQAEQQRAQLIIIGEVAEAERRLQSQREEDARKEQERARKLQESRTALNRQRIAEEEEADRKLQAHRTAMNRQRYSEEEEAARKLQAHRTAMARQRYAEEEAAEKKLADHRTAMNRQRLSEEEEAERKLMASRTGLARQRYEMEVENENKLAAHRTAMNLQRLQEEEAADARLLAHRESMARQQVAEEERRTQQYQEAIRRRIQAEEVARKAGEAARQGVAGAETVRIRAEADTKEADAELAFLLGLASEIDGKKLNVTADLDAARFLAGAAAVSTATKAMNNDAERSSGIFGALSGTLGQLFGSLEQGGNRIASFDNLIRGLMTLGITVFLQQLIQVAGAAAGALLALASSAATAGAALGGMAVAGIAQAIPAVGLLATAMSRMKNVFDAAKQSNLLQQQQSYQGAKAADTQATALDGVRSAQEGLANAQRGVLQAQERITTARRDAARQLQDLILAEKEADLAARGATISQEEAQSALQSAIRRGDTGALARRELAVDEADVGVTRATQRQTRARSDASTARSRGVEGAPGVRQAKEALADAERAAVSAERGLARAQRSAEQAAAGTTAAAGKLDYLLANLSGAERRMYEAVIRLQTVWRRFAQEASEPLINAFTRGISRVTEILRNPIVIGAARLLSSRMADAFSRVFDAFSDDRTLGRFAKFADEAGKNMRPLADIAINLGRAFLNIGEAAAPALRRTLDWIVKLTDAFADWTDKASKGGDDSPLAKFFQEGVTHLEAWVKLLGSIGGLFLAIAGPGGGAKEGLGLVEDMTDGINKMAEAIKTPGTEANKFFTSFFKLSRQMLGELRPIAEAIGREFQKTFTKDGVGSVKGFASFMADVLIPAIGDFIRQVGKGTAALGHFVRANPEVAKIGSTLIALVLTMATFGKVFSLFEAPLKILGRIGGMLFNVSKGFDEAGKAVTKLGGPLGRIVTRLGIMEVVGPRIATLMTGPWGILAGIFVLLLARFGRLDNLWRAIKTAASEFFARVKGPFAELKEAISGITDAFSGNGGLMPVIKLLVTLISGVLGGVIVTLGRMIGNVFGGAIRIISGVLNIFTAILTLDFDRFVKGLSQIGHGIVQGILSPIGNLFELLTRPFRRAVNWILNFLGIASPSRRFRRIGLDLINGLIDGLGSMGRAILGAFRSGWGVAWDFLSSLPRRALSIGERIARAIASGIRRLPDLIGDLFGQAGGLVKNVVGSITKFINDKTPFGDVLVSFFGKDLRLPKLPERFAKGGPVPGTGDGDTVSALLTPGEHVLTKSEVAAAGGHAAIFALRRLLGGGGQGRGFRFADGGGVGDGESGGNISADATVTLKSNFKDFTAEFRKSWSTVLNIARVNSGRVAKEYRDMRVAIEATMTRLSRIVNERWDQIAKRATDDAEDMWRGVRSNVMKLQTTVFRGMSYVGSTANKALKAFDADPISLSISAPSGGAESRAGGGFIGNQGERGRDAIPTWLGRGEAVLNWGQQKIVNSALAQAYGTDLDEMFKRTRGYHAGGHGNSPGFARGGRGMPDVMGSKVGFAAFMQYFRAKFGKDIYVISGNRPGSITTSGNVSNHAAGNAIDISNPISVGGSASNPPPRSNLDRLHAFIARQIPQPPRLDFLWRTTTGGNHFNHIHLGLSPAVTATIAAARKWIAKNLPEGGDFGGDTSVAMQKIAGTAGPLKELLTSLVKRVTKAANKFLDRQLDDNMDIGEGPDSVPLGPGGNAKKAYDYFINRGLTPMQAAAFVGNFQQESSVNPHANQPDGPGRGIAQWSEGARWETLKAFAGKRDPESLQVQLDFVWHELTTGYKGALSALRSANTLEEAVAIIAHQYEVAGIVGDRVGPARAALQAYGRDSDHKNLHAEGGFVGGEEGYARGGELPGSGQPIPIIAHGGEWILNNRQKAMLAGAMGTTVDRIRAMLGFGGKGHSFADGGDVRALHVGDSLGEGIARALARYLGASNVTDDSRRNRTSDEGLDIITEKLRQKLKRAYTSVIFDLGTNDQHASTLARNLRKAYGLLKDDQTLVVPTVRGPRAAEKNAAIRDFAEGKDNVRVVDISSLARYTRGDPQGIHMNAEGYTQRARLIGAAARRRAASADYEAPGEGDRKYDIPAINVAGVTAEIGKLQKIVTKLNRRSGWRENLTKFISNVSKLTGGNESDEGLLNVLGAAIERRGAQLERGLNLAQAGFVRLGRSLRTATPLADAAAIAEATAKNLEEIGVALRAQRRVATTGLAQIERAISRIRAGGVTDKESKAYRDLVVARRAFNDRIDEIDDKIIENANAKLEAQQTAFTETTNRLLRENTRSQNANTLATRIATAFGRSEQLPGLAQAQIANLQEQQRIVGGRLAEAQRRAARDPRWQSVADELATQMDDLTGQVAEAQAQIFNDMVTAMESAISRRMAAIDISGRMNDIQERMGNRLGAAQARLGLSDQRSSALYDQFVGYSNLRAVAVNEGRTDAIADLTDKMNEAVAAMNEEAQTRRELVFTYRQTATDLISGRQERGTGLIGTARDIIQRIGEAAGLVNTDKIRSFLEETAEILRNSAIEIAQNLGAAIGAGEFGAGGSSLLAQLRAAFMEGPESFGSRLAQLAPAIAGLEATMGDTQRTAFQALIQSMIDNTTATLDNSKTIQDLSGALAPQGFSSTSWQWFREAIFNGMGDVLPQYDVPHASTGGYVARSGLMNVHAGELIVNPARNPISDGDINITVHEVEGKVDTEYIAARVGWERSRRRASR